MLNIRRYGWTWHEMFEVGEGIPAEYASALNQQYWEFRRQDDAKNDAKNNANHQAHSIPPTPSATAASVAVIIPPADTHISKCTTAGGKPPISAVSTTDQGDTNHEPHSTPTVPSTTAASDVVVSTVCSTIFAPTEMMGCATCGVKNKPLKLCGRCHSISYCSVECQRQDWHPHHRLVGPTHHPPQRLGLAPCLLRVCRCVERCLDRRSANPGPHRMPRNKLVPAHRNSVKLSSSE
jgi:hypothetical protein